MKELNIYNILQGAITGTKLFTPDFGWLYLHTQSNDNYRNGWLGNDKAIKLTKKKPPYPLSQFGGYGQYRYEDIDYCFDEYGHLYLTDPERHRDDRSYMKEGEVYRFNGRKFLTLDCHIFPDEEKTWDNWQLKLFKPGDMVVLQYCTDLSDPCNYWVKYTGTLRNIRHGAVVKREIYCELSDVVVEYNENRITSHEYLKEKTCQVLKKCEYPARFATFQDYMEHRDFKKLCK